MADEDLLAGAARGDAAAVRDALGAGADVEARDGRRRTALLLAAAADHVEYVREVLKTGIDVDHVNDLGWTGLLEAVILGDGGERHQEVVRLLVAAGADVDLADRDGVTPLAHAVAKGRTEVAALLRAAGAH